MKFLSIFKKKPLKRIELKAHSKNSKIRFRGSRVGGLNIAYHPLRGITFNSKHGLRVSKTIRGLTLGFQRGNPILRGRWSSKESLLNLNLSKSGFSISTKNKFGTYNITHPNRSSFKFGGIQVRGKKAKLPALIFTLFTLFKVMCISLFNTVLTLINLFVYLKVIFIPVIWAFNIVYLIFYIIFNFILYLFIDLPKQIINKIFKRDLFFIGEYLEDGIFDLLKSIYSEADTKLISERLINCKYKAADLSIIQKSIKYIYGILGLVFWTIGIAICINRAVYVINGNELTYIFLLILILGLTILNIGRKFILIFLLYLQQKEDERIAKAIGINV